MGQLNREHLDKIENYLDQQGLTFKPLRDEMMDHLIGDLEGHIEKGTSFDEAWDLIKSDIPDNHFKTIQTEIMETIDKRFNLSKGFTYLSLVLLFAMSVFKLLHFPLSGILLLAAFGAIVAALLTSTLYGVYLYKEKKGGLMVFGTIAGIILFLISFGFQILHLPGLVGLRTISVILLILFFPGLTVYFGTKRTSGENILTHLHKKHSPGIERYLIILLALSVTLRIALLAFGSSPDVSHVLLVLVIGGAGLQYFALNWHNQNGQNWLLLTGLVLAFLCFILPALIGQFYTARVILTTGFYLITGLIVLKRSNEIFNKKILLILIATVSVLFTALALVNLNIIDTALNSMIFNLPVLALLLSGLIYFIKHPLTKVYMIMVIAHYMFEYPNQLGLW